MKVGLCWLGWLSGIIGIALLGVLIGVLVRGKGYLSIYKVDFMIMKEVVWVWVIDWLGWLIRGAGIGLWAGCRCRCRDGL